MTVGQNPNDPKAWTPEKIDEVERELLRIYREMRKGTTLLTAYDAIAVGEAIAFIRAHRATPTETR
jgi:hypothetical protein